MAGEMSVGAFTAVFASLNMMFMIMNEVVSYHLGNMSQHIGKVANLIHLLEREEVIQEEGMPDFAQGIITEDVSFTYPGKKEPAVEQLSLHIKEKETIAIVGANGAGKSTVARLLIGLYQPTQGTVKLGGVNSQHVNPKSLYSQTSAVFQRYQRYQMSLLENVTISHLNTSFCEKSVQEVLDQVAFTHEAVNLQTMLAPEFGGIDLSGGQWQRLAIARGLYRTNEFIVLDEPTAAIDPIEESNVYNQFKRLAQDKTAVLITHRLGSAKFADRIIVMDKGSICEVGTHDELIAHSGHYAHMWQTQAKWY